MEFDFGDAMVGRGEKHFFTILVTQWWWGGVKRTFGGGVVERGAVMTWRPRFARDPAHSYFGALQPGTNVLSHVFEDI